MSDVIYLSKCSEQHLNPRFLKYEAHFQPLDRTFGKSRSLVVNMWIRKETVVVWLQVVRLPASEDVKAATIIYK